MGKLKVVVIYDRVLVDEDEETAAGDKAPVVRTLDKKEVEEEVADALTKLGHEPVLYEVDGTLKSLLGLSRVDCDVVFNLCESFNGDDTADFKIAAYLELIGKKYTGSGTHGLMLAGVPLVFLAVAKQHLWYRRCERRDIRRHVAGKRNDAVVMPLAEHRRAISHGQQVVPPTSPSSAPTVRKCSRRASKCRRTHPRSRCGDPTRVDWFRVNTRYAFASDPTIRRGCQLSIRRVSSSRRTFPRSATV